MPPRSGQPAEIAVGTVGLAEIALEPALAVLSGPELERARRITSRDYFAQHVKGRALLRRWLGHVTGQSPKSLQIVENASGAPRLAINPSGIHFSLSHSHDWVLLALSRSPVGVDIERVDTGVDCEAIAEVCLHASERERLWRMQPGARAQAFFEFWTCKEAYMKGIGTGLSTDPASFSTLGTDGAVSPDGQGPSVRIWYTRLIDAPAGYKAALACHSPHARVTYCQLGAILAEAEPAGAARALRGPPAIVVPATPAWECAA